MPNMQTNQLREFISTTRGIKNITFIYTYAYEYIISHCLERAGGIRAHQWRGNTKRSYPQPSA